MRSRIMAAAPRSSAGVLSRSRQASISSEAPTGAARPKLSSSRFPALSKSARAGQARQFFLATAATATGVAMRITAFSALALGFGLVTLQLSACSNTADDCNATASCDTASTAGTSGSSGASGGSNGAEGGSGSTSGAGKTAGGASNTSGSMGAGSGGGDGGGGDGGSGCSGEVSDDAACWTTEEYGVFVSSDHGDDSTATGTRQFPYKTLSKALGASGSRNIYVCVGSDDYTERVFLDRPSTAVHIYGGFECENWTYDVARRAQVTSPTQIALRIQGATKGVTIENMEFTAANGSGDNASSYGAFITDSKDVVLKRVKLTAGDGLDGADGADGEKGADGVAPGAEQNGEPALCPGGTAHSKGGVAIDALCG